MSTFGKFNDNMSRRGRNVSLNADQIVRKCALAVDGAVVISTPVDTGRARSNWQVEVNQPKTNEIPPYSPGKEGSTGGPNARAAIEQGKAAIARYKGGSADAALYLTNNLAYIGKLNDGSSAQAPAGFVEKATMVGINAIRRDAGQILSDSWKG